MYCNISGQTPEEPVINKKTGHLYEKSLITKYIDAHGKCPMTGEPLTLEDLLPVQTTKTTKPRPTNATSIPGMLALFQNEWDALMLETFTLKQHLDTVRKELSNALYQHDAACRVIARLIKERDGARSALAHANANTDASQTGSSDAMEVEAQGIPAESLTEMTEKSAELSAQRKKRKISPELAPVDVIHNYKMLSSHPLHKTTEPGITCMALHPTKQHLVMTGGVDKEAVVFNRDTGRVVSSLSGHSKALTDVLFHPTRDILFTASQDKTALIWSSNDSEDEYSVAHTVRIHNDSVTGIALQPTGSYLATSSADCSWGLHALHTSQTLLHIKDPKANYGIGCIEFHPDGLILGTGTDENMVRIWDLKVQTNVASFKGHQGPVSSIAFSENGYYLASIGSTDGLIKLWDLRRLQNFATLNLEGSQLTAVTFDHSGNYLAASGQHGVRVYKSKEWTEIKHFRDHSELATDVVFGKDAKFMASVSMDRSLKFYGL